MKRSFRAEESQRGAVFLLKLLAALAALLAAFGAQAQSSADPNQLLAFKKIFVEPIQDNVDGAFRAPVEQSYREVFDRNPRFELLADKAQADTVLRTVITKKTTGIDLDITLLLAATGEVFTTEHESIPVSATGHETGTKIKQLLKAALKRIPFYGTVTGRDGKELTFDIGASHGLRARDIIQVSRIDNIKRHPLLKSIVDVQLVPVGSAVIDSVEDTISFGHVKDEITGETIQKLHKITAIEGHLPEPVAEKPREKSDGGPAYVQETDNGAKDASKDDNRPQVGYVGLGASLSSFSSTTQASANSTAVAGSGFSPGVRVNAELWLTKRWFADLMIGISPVSYSQTLASSTVTNSPSISTTTRTFGISAGYKYLPENDIYGPQVFVKLGYMSFTWSTPISQADLLSSKTYSGLNLGLGGVLPISSRDWGAMLNVNVLLFPGLTEEETYKPLGTDASASGATFFIGGYHYFTPNIAVRAGPQIEIFSADNNASGASTSQKTFGLLGSVLYYF